MMQNLFNIRSGSMPGATIPRLDQFGEESRPVDRWPLASDLHPFALRPDIDSGVMHVRHNDGVGSLASGRWQPDVDTFDTILKSSTTTEPENGPIVVTGTRISGGDIVWTHATGGDPGGLTGPTGEITPPNEGEPPPPDENEIIITVNVNRPLTPSEQQALQNLQHTINAINAAIMALANNALLTLPNGATVIGSQLKEIWAKTDFIINDNSFTYSNGGQGEARMWLGEPTISFNVGYLDSYDAFNGGMNYLVAHEIGHLTQAGASFYTDQRTANDISRALLNGAQLEYLSSPAPEYGDTPNAPMQFSIG